MAIFTHEDGQEPNVDYLSVTDERTYLLFDGQSPGDGLGDVSTRVRVDRDAALRLHTALGAWISGDNVPVCDPDSLYGQLIRQAVREELARAIPECLAQTQAPAPDCTLDEPCDVADDPHPLDVCRGGYGCEVLDYHAPYSPGCGRPDPDPEPLLFRCRRCGASPNGAHENCAGDERACVYIRPGDAGYDLLADPEPHDVGHPTYEDARPLVRVGPSHCGGCTHPMNDHTWIGGCWGANGSCACEVQQDAPVPVVESDKVWGEAGQPPVKTTALKCTCIHETEYPHRPEYNGCTRTGCLCKYVPSAPPVHCTCEHDRQMHGRFGCRILGCACRWKRGTS